MVKRRKPLLSIKHGKRRVTLLSSIRTGLWRTGPELFGQMRQKSIGLGQMEECMCEKKQASLYRTRNSEVWRRFLDGLEMHGLEWSRNVCRDGGVDGC